MEPNRRDAVGDRDTGQTGTANEPCDTADAVGNCNAGQAGTAIEPSDTFDSVANRDVGQAGAIVERIVLNRGDAVGDRNTGQVVSGKGIRTDRSNRQATNRSWNVDRCGSVFGATRDGDFSGFGREQEVLSAANRRQRGGDHQNEKQDRIDVSDPGGDDAPTQSGCDFGFQIHGRGWLIPPPLVESQSPQRATPSEAGIRTKGMANAEILRGRIPPLRGVAPMGLSRVPMGTSATLRFAVPSGISEAELPPLKDSPRAPLMIAMG